MQDFLALQDILVIIICLWSWISVIILSLVQYKMVSRLCDTMLQNTVASKAQTIDEWKKFIGKSLPSVKKDMKKAEKEDDILMQQMKKQAEEAERKKAIENDDWEDWV